MEERAHGRDVAVGGGEVQRSGARRGDDGHGGVSGGIVARGIDVCVVVDEEADGEVIPPRQDGVEGEHAVEEGVDGLAMGEGILDIDLTSPMFPFAAVEWRTVQ